MTLPGRALAGGEPERRAAQLAGDIDPIAGTGSGSEKGLAARNGAADDHIAGEFFRAGEVASSERRFATEGEKSVVEAVHPVLIRPARNREREQTEARVAAHRRDVAQAARERFMADILRPMGIPPKVDILEQQVGGDE